MSHQVVKGKLLEVFDEIFEHHGFGEFKVEMKILKRQQKEVIINCGKEYRYILDYNHKGGSTLSRSA
jgi:hypothetical protein